MHSATEVGFESAKTIGLLLIFAAAWRMAGEKARAFPVVPIKAVDLTVRNMETPSDRIPGHTQTAVYSLLDHRACLRPGLWSPQTSSAGAPPFQANLCSTIAAMTKLAIPVPASPAPKNRSRWSAKVSPVMRSAVYKPANTTAAVPWISSLKQQTRWRYLVSKRKALSRESPRTG